MTPELFASKYAELEQKVAQLESIGDEVQRLRQSLDTRLARNERNSRAIIDEYLSAGRRELAERKREAEKEAARLQGERRLLADQRQKDKEALEQLFKQKSVGFPWLAKACSDYLSLRDEEMVFHLENKDRPALKTAQIVRQLSAERRHYREQRQVLHYLLEYYECLFPWLSEFREDDLDDFVRQPAEPDAIANAEFGEQADPARKWLTSAEYTQLSATERNQVALDRYWQRRKSAWQIGRDYERYVGYEYEMEGFEVKYEGVIKGFEDLGRDLICMKGGYTAVVQCKCWSHGKLIHEKHINQLFGTTVMYAIHKRRTQPAVQLELFSDWLKSEKIRPRFVTSTSLSDTAREFARFLGVDVTENHPLGQYPSIKCNVSRRTAERIYHLPFDQQYDRTVIEEERNERYVSTVAEAEEAGYRRAFRWPGHQTEKP